MSFEPAVAWLNLALPMGAVARVIDAGLFGVPNAGLSEVPPGTSPCGLG